MLESEFVIGDVVRVKGQEQRMTISRFRYYDLVTCIWFDTEGHLQEGIFDCSTLRLVKAGI